MESKVSCTNNKCEHNFNDSCTKLDKTNKVYMLGDGVCKDFEYGINDGYRVAAWYEKELAEINEIKKQVNEITNDL